MRYLIWRLSAFLVCCIMLAAIGGCSRPTVLVVDQSGMPVVGANIYAVSLSINNGPTITNAKGIAAVPGNVQGTKWIEVSKPGYGRVQVPVPTAWPLRVTLAREAAQ